MGTTTADTLCEQLSKSFGDFLSFSTTTNIAANNLVVSTTLASWDNGADDYFIGWYVYIKGTTNNGVERKISDYATATGTITVFGAALAAESGSVVCEIRRYSREKCLDAINHATLESFPKLGYYQEDISIVSGNWLPNNSFEKWTSSSYPDFWKVVGVTAEQITTTGLGYQMGKSSSAKITATADGGYLGISSKTYPRLLDLAGQTVSLKVWAAPEVANDVTATILTVNIDGTANTYDSTTTSVAGNYTLITIDDQKLDDELNEILIYFSVATDTKWVYLDNARLTAKQIDQYFVPVDIRNSRIQAVYIQEDWATTKESYEPCDSLSPTKWKRIYNWHYWTDNEYDWIEIPDLPTGYLIRIIIFSPLETLTAATDTISIDSKNVLLLLAYARYKLFQAERGLPSAKDTTRVEKMMAEALTEYNRLLPNCSVNKLLETVRIVN